MFLGLSKTTTRMIQVTNLAYYIWDRISKTNNQSIVDDAYRKDKQIRLDDFHSLIIIVFKVTSRVRFESDFRLNLMRFSVLVAKRRDTNEQTKNIKFQLSYNIRRCRERYRTLENTNLRHILMTTRAAPVIHPVRVGHGRWWRRRAQKSYLETVCALTRRTWRPPELLSTRKIIATPRGFRVAYCDSRGSKIKAT